MRLPLILIAAMMVCVVIATAQAEDILKLPTAPAENEAHLPTVEEKAAAEKKLAEEKARQEAMLKWSGGYFERCLATMYTEFPKATQEDFCACSAAAVQTKTTIEQAQALAEAKAISGIVEIERGVMIPCADVLVREYERARLLSDQAFLDYFQTQQSAYAGAHCVSGKVADFIRETGMDAMAAIIAQNPQVKDQDMLTAILESNLYKGERDKITTACMNQYAFK